MSTTIRFAAAVDAPTVGALLHDFNTEFGSPTPSAEEFAERFKLMLTRSDVAVLLAERERERDPVGFALLTARPTPYADGPLTQLEELYVRPGLRGDGAGSALLEEAMVWSTSLGALEMHIGVDEVDADARRFYERHGFSCVEPAGDGMMLFYERGL